MCGDGERPNWAGSLPLPGAREAVPSGHSRHCDWRYHSRGSHYPQLSQYDNSFVHTDEHLLLQEAFLDNYTFLIQI